MPTIGIVAGESSGDLLGSHLIAALKKHRPDLEFVGIAGPKMISQGANSLYPMERLSLHGYGWDVLKQIPSLLKMRKQLAQDLLNRNPSVFIGIDAPDFNFTLERKLKRNGVKTVHYVSPSIWAWRKGRMGKIKRAVTHMLALFPFETSIYQKAGMHVSYVGHPLADVLPLEPNTAAARDQLKLKQHQTVFAFLPGSRVNEVKQLASLYVRTAYLIAQKNPQAQFLVPLITRATKKIFEEALYAFEVPEGHYSPNIQVLFGHAHMAMEAADAVLVASGTATLEAALLKKPMVITYKLPWLSWQIMRHMNYLPYVGLPNILAGKLIVPELLQKEAAPEKVSKALTELTENQVLMSEIKQTFHDMHVSLKQNTEEKAALAILGYL